MTRRGKALAAVVSFVVVGIALLFAFTGGRKDRERIRFRYEQMQTALRSGDTNAAVRLFAPEHRARAAEEFQRLLTFALPLDGRSRISLGDDRAWICPRNDLPLLPIITVGDAVEMMKVGEEWYFTGRISIW